MSDPDTENNEIVSPDSADNQMIWHSRNDMAMKTFWKIRALLEPYGMLDTRMAFSNFISWMNPRDEPEIDELDYINNKHHTRNVIC